MPEQENHTASPHSEEDAPWWVRICRWLWEVAAFLGISVILSLAINVLSAWFTGSPNSIPTNSPLGWLLAHWPLTLLIGCGLLLFALAIRILSRWPIQTSGRISPSQQNRTRILRRLHRSYEDLLTQSLQGAAWIDLELAQKPDAVRNTTNLLLQTQKQPAQPLPIGTSIIDAYTLAEHELLILGEPGAGKSTLLLNLAQYLVEQAHKDDTSPLPIILPLSSWASKQQAIQDWTYEQLAEIYDVPRNIAQRWMKEEQLLLLLDGLDEMEASARPACITAINTYHRSHLARLVVCSRKKEYENAATQLILQNAVIIQPLTTRQVETFLNGIGKPLAALRQALKKNPALQELATTPLMLNVLMLTYQGTAVRSLSKMNEQLQKQIWNDYTERMITRKGNVQRYPHQQTYLWLRWMARQMREHNQTVFYLEHLQPDWLTGDEQGFYKWVAVLLPAIVIGMLASIILIGLSSLTGIVQESVVGGFLGGLWGASLPQITRERTRYQAWVRHLFTSLFIGLLFGMSFGFSQGFSLSSLSTWWHEGLLFGAFAGLGSFLLLFFFARKPQCPILVCNQPIQHWQWLVLLLQKASVQRNLLVGAIFGLLYGLMYGLGHGLDSALGQRLNQGVIYGLDYGLNYGLNYGLISALIGLVVGRAGIDIHLAERLKWTWRSLKRSLLSSKHLRMTLFVASCFTLLGLSIGLIYGLGTGLLYGFLYGLSIGLGYWFAFGLFQGIAQERIEDRDRQVANEGIRRSLHNSIIMSILGGEIIGVIGLLGYGLANGLSTGLNSGLSTGINSGLSTALGTGITMGLLLGISGGGFVWLLTGGMTVLRHITIRFLLWRSGTFPRQTLAFLDDATARILLRRVGGGYSFMHRLLLEHFADMDLEIENE